MNIHQDRQASSGQWLRRHDLQNFITTLYEGDLQAKRVLSLANATVGVLTSASLAIHAVGRGLAQAMGTLTKHGVKQVDRLLSNRGVDVWAFFAYWTPFIVGARTEVVVALDWTSFAADGQDTIVLSMAAGHGRATPLLWKTVASSTLKGNQRRYEYEVLCRLREVLPAGVKVTVVADRGFGDCKAVRHVAGPLSGWRRRLVGRAGGQDSDGTFKPGPYSVTALPARQHLDACCPAGPTDPCQDTKSVCGGVRTGRAAARSCSQSAAAIAPGGEPPPSTPSPPSSALPPSATSTPTTSSSTSSEPPRQSLRLTSVVRRT